MKFSKILSLNRYQWASAIINQYAQTKPIIFDIGARDAIIKEYITKNIDYQGYDLKPDNDLVREWNLEDEPQMLEKADCILFLEVIEYLHNPWLCLSNLSKALKPNGTLILTTPNPFWSESRFTLFIKGSMPCFTEQDLFLNNHVFTPWPHIVALDGKTVIFDRQLFSNPLRIFKRLIKVFLEALNKNACGMSYGIIAKKNETA